VGKTISDTLTFCNGMDIKQSAAFLELKISQQSGMLDIFFRGKVSPERGFEFEH